MFTTFCWWSGLDRTDISLLAIMHIWGGGAVAYNFIGPVNTFLVFNEAGPHSGTLWVGRILAVLKEGIHIVMVGP